MPLGLSTMQSAHDGACRPVFHFFTFTVVGPILSQTAHVGFIHALVGNVDRLDRALARAVSRSGLAIMLQRCQRLLLAILRGKSQVAHNVGILEGVALVRRVAPKELFLRHHLVRLDRLEHGRRRTELVGQFPDLELAVSAHAAFLVTSAGMGPRIGTAMLMEAARSTCDPRLATESHGARRPRSMNKGPFQDGRAAGSTVFSAIATLGMGTALVTLLLHLLFVRIIDYFRQLKRTSRILSHCLDTVPHRLEGVPHTRRGRGSFTASAHAICSGNTVLLLCSLRHSTSIAAAAAFHVRRKHAARAHRVQLALFSVDASAIPFATNGILVGQLALSLA